MKLNIGNIYIYQIEPREETSWYLPLLSPGDDWGERNCHLKLQVPHKSISGQFFGESLATTHWTNLIDVWANQALHAPRRPQMAAGQLRRAARPFRAICGLARRRCLFMAGWPGSRCFKSFWVACHCTCHMRTPLSTGHGWSSLNELWSYSCKKEERRL